MSNKSRRNTQLPPRPRVIPEQLREQLGIGNHIFNRDECIQFIGMWTGNLAKRINADPRLPWVTATIDHRPNTNGMTLHVQVIHNTADDTGALTAAAPNVHAMPATSAPRNRKQSTKLVNQLAESQAFLLNAKKQLPYLRIAMNRRSDGFSLTIDILDQVITA